MNHRYISGPEIEVMIDDVRTGAHAAGLAASKLDRPDCVVAQVAVGTAAVMTGIGNMAQALIGRLEVEGPCEVGDCATWVATAMFHNGETSWRQESNTAQFAPHCGYCGPMTYNTGAAQYMSGCLALLQALASLTVIEGEEYEMNPLRVRALAHSCENDLHRMIEEVFRR
ncbi:hypothetical protein SEA_LIGMA_63 [Gordonia phage Ligma]|nr:hypothetical protein SEA_LIGMA_63 [Gordonia phage Ligma]UQT02162.1 hypothetical protein SEA_AXUMITE_63 [Gordonia phage Axumite]